MGKTMKDTGIPWIKIIPIDWAVLRNKGCFDCSKEIIGEASSETQLLSLTTKGIKKKRPEDSTGKVPESYDTYQTVVPNDIVMCLFDLDVSAVFSGISPYYGMISPAYRVLKCKHNIVPQYADYWFAFVFDGRKFKHYSKNLRYTLTYDEFATLPIVLPSLDEQHRIVSFIDTECTRIDAVINQTRSSIEEYKKLKQAIIMRAVTKGIRSDRSMKDSGIEWVGSIAGDYKLVKLKYVLSEQLKYGANQAGIPYDNDLPRYIRITDITSDGRLKQSEMLSLSEEDAKGYILKDNDVLFARSGATVGKAFIYKSTYGRSAFAGYLIKASLSKSLLPDLLFFYTQSSIYEEWKKHIFIQATIQNIGADRYREMPIILQPINEQKEIVEYISAKCSEIDSIIRGKEALLQELELYKKSLIYEYITGKKEVSE